MTGSGIRPWLVSVAIILLYILLFAGSAGKPLQLDNMDFPAVAKATAFSGLPVYYRGEEKPHQPGLYHPPLYIYLLAAWIRLFGFGEAQVRLFGMVFSLLQGAVVLAILRELFGSARVCQWSPWFWALFLLNPFTFGAAAITDIDSTIYGPLLCLVVLLAVRVSWRDGEWRSTEPAWSEYAALAVALTVCMWAKLTTVALLFPVLFLLLPGRLGLRRSAAITVGMAAASAALFAISYYLYGAFTGLDIGYTYRFTWTSFMERGSTARGGIAALLSDYRRNLAFMIPFMLSWTALLPWAAAVAAVTVALFRGRGDRRMLHYAIVLGMAVTGTFYYCAKVVTFGFSPFKYVFVFWALIMTAPLFLMNEWTGQRLKITGRTLAAAATVFLVTSAWATVVLRDTLIIGLFKGPHRWSLIAPGLLFLASVAAARLSKRIGLLPAVASLALYGGVSFGTAVYQQKAPYATTYDYGQTGFLDTVAFLKSNTQPDDIIVSMKDIGFGAGLRYFETYDPIYLNDEVKLAHIRDAISTGKIAYAVFTEGRGQDQLFVNPPFERWILGHCTLVRSFGNYRVYRPSQLVGRCVAGCVPATAQSNR